MLTGFGFAQDEALNMSNEVAKLGADLASFTNVQGGAKTAVEALTKGLLGEREMMKSLGIAILESDLNARLLEKGQNKLTGSALRVAKAQATLELAMEQSKNAIGDFARSQGSLANQWKIMMARLDDLSVSIGTIFIPLGKSMVKVVVSLTKSVQDNMGTIVTWSYKARNAILTAAKFWVKQYANVAVVIENWESILMTLGDNMKVILTNAFNFWSTVFKNMLTNARDFWANILEYPIWFVDNFKKILTNAFNFWKTTFSNMADNIVMLFANIDRLITGELDFNNLWKPLTDGFKKAVLTELPKFKYDPKNLMEGFESKQTTQSVSNMWDNITNIQEKRANELMKSLGLVNEVERAAVKAEDAISKASGTSGSAKTSTQAARSSSRESKSSIVSISDISKSIQVAVSGRRDKQTKLLERQVKIQERQVTVSEQIRDKEPQALLN
jgi:hypothetical protein